MQVKDKDFFNQQAVWLLNEKYHGVWSEGAQKEIERLRKGEPVEYVLGYKKFLGSVIDLSQKPLIPRDETEFWVGKAIEEVWSDIGSRSILDIFAGTGCIGLAVLKNIKNSHCDFADVDEKAIKQIKINLVLHKIPQARFQVIQSDVFSGLTGKKYNYIFANPPYVSVRNKKAVQTSVFKYEPRKAVFAKQNGFYFMQKFLGEAKSHLAPNGKIYLEFGASQKPGIAKMLKKFGYSNFEFRKDQFNKWRWVEIWEKIG